MSSPFTLLLYTLARYCLRLPSHTTRPAVILASGAHTRRLSKSLCNFDYNKVAKVRVPTTISGKSRLKNHITWSTYNVNNKTKPLDALFRPRSRERQGGRTVNIIQNICQPIQLKLFVHDATSWVMCAVFTLPSKLAALKTTPHAAKCHQVDGLSSFLLQWTVTLYITSHNQAVISVQ